MGSAARSLSEPHVLAHAKGALFPDDAPDAYAVVDTQFAVDEWLPGRPIEPDLRERLAPFNHVRIGNGYPDLVGVRQLDAELLAVDRLGEQPPLIAVEAKGYAGGDVDTETGIVQAYGRLHEANAAYLAAPVEVVSKTDRTLARELNVGILGVDADGTVDPLEVPRVVGNRTTTEATALRFQASAQGVADNSFSLNHPKNYLGYPIAHYADGDTDALLTQYKVVGATAAARQGAAFLDLIDDGPRGVELTHLGQEVVRFALARCSSAEDALAEFESWYRSPTRFVDLAPAWGQLARRIVYAYPATSLLVTELQAIHDDGATEPTLVDLVTSLHDVHPSFTVELFIKGEPAVRRRVLDERGRLQRDALDDGTVYHAPTVFQLKAMCYHAGILTHRGAEPHRLDPTTDVWALRNSV